MVHKSRILVIVLLVISFSSCNNSEQVKSIYLDGMELSQFRNIDFEQLQKSIDASDGVDKPMDVL